MVIPQSAESFLDSRGRSSPWQGIDSLSRTIVHLQVLWVIESGCQLLRSHKISLSSLTCRSLPSFCDPVDVLSLRKLSVEGEYLKSVLAGRIAGSPSMREIVFFRPYGRKFSTNPNTTCGTISANMGSVLLYRIFPDSSDDK